MGSSPNHENRHRSPFQNIRKWNLANVGGLYLAVYRGRQTCGLVPLSSGDHLFVILRPGVPGPPHLTGAFNPEDREAVASSVALPCLPALATEP